MEGYVVSLSNFHEADQFMSLTLNAGFKKCID